MAESSSGGKPDAAGTPLRTGDLGEAGEGVSAATASGGSPGVSNKPAKTVVEVTYDTVVRRHEISDETLARLESGNHSFYFDVFLFAGAVFLGSVVPGIDRWANLKIVPTPFDLFVIFAPVAAILFTVVFGVAWLREQGGVRRIAKNIRDRPTRPGK